MITEPAMLQRQKVLEIASTIDSFERVTFEPVLDAISFRTQQSGSMLFEMNQRCSDEYFVLAGACRLFVLSPEGDEVTLSFTEGPNILPPAISRTLEGRSLVSCDALSDIEVGVLTSEALIGHMVNNPAMQRWGDAVMRSELLRRSERELGLATKTAKDRLHALRELYPKLEASVPHSMIASFLGVTPVTLSRIRNESDRQ